MPDRTEAAAPRLDNCRRLGLPHRWVWQGRRLRCRNCAATPRDALLYQTTLWLLLGAVAAVLLLLLYFSKEVIDLLH
jgi:hypothetical protein